MLGWGVKHVLKLLPIKVSCQPEVQTRWNRLKEPLAVRLFRTFNQFNQSDSTDKMDKLKTSSHIWKVTSLNPAATSPCPPAVIWFLHFHCQSLWTGPIETLTTVSCECEHRKRWMFTVRYSVSLNKCRFSRPILFNDETFLLKKSLIIKLLEKWRRLLNPVYVKEKCLLQRTKTAVGFRFMDTCFWVTTPKVFGGNTS